MTFFWLLPSFQLLTSFHLKNLYCFKTGISSFASRSLSPIPIYVSHYYLPLFPPYSLIFFLSFVLPLTHFSILKWHAHILWILMRVLKCWESMFHLTLISLPFDPHLPVIFNLRLVCFVCALVISNQCSYVPVCPTWAFQCDTSCLQGSQVPIMAGGSGPGKPTQASGISSRLDSPLPFPQDKLTCLITQEPASP